MKILLVSLLFLVAAQLPSCGVQEETLVGFVDDKLVVELGGHPRPVIYIGATEYEVPWEFWRQVEINDLVKWEKGKWTIVRKARG